MKKFQKLCLWILILCSIDYSITSLMGFNLLYARIKDLYLWHSIYAFVLGISAFISILLFKKED